MHCRANGWRFLRLFSQAFFLYTETRARVLHDIFQYLSRSVCFFFFRYSKCQRNNGFSKNFTDKHVLLIRWINEYEVSIHNTNSKWNKNNFFYQSPKSNVSFFFKVKHIDEFHWFSLYVHRYVSLKKWFWSYALVDFIFLFHLLYVLWMKTLYSFSVIQINFEILLFSLAI